MSPLNTMYMYKMVIFCQNNLMLHFSILLQNGSKSCMALIVCSEKSYEL